MKLKSREQIESLSQFDNRDLLTTSLFLDTSKNRLTKKEIKLGLKNLLNNGKLKIDGSALAKTQKDSLLKDLEKIKKLCSEQLVTYNHVGLAIFSCSGGNFWQVYNLVKSPRNMIVFDHDPYVRPLSAVINEYHRVCILVFDRKEAKWYDLYMGELLLLDSFEGDVPSRIREGGREGYSSKRIERHMISRFHEFLKKTAKKTSALMKSNHSEWLFIGTKDEYMAEFEPLLHPYLKQKMKARIKLKPADSKAKVKQTALALKDRLKKEEKDNIVLQFVNEQQKKGLAVSGLKNTLRKLNRGEIQTLLVTRHFSQAGKSCPKCGFLFVDEVKCPSCQVKTKSRIDIIDEAVEAALNTSCQVQHMNPPSPLDKFGGIGAFLRYKS